MTGSTEDRLRDVFDTLAGQVQTSPDAYRRVAGEWRRRERRRRLVVTLLAAAVIAAADGAALWALNRADPGVHVIFTDPTTPPPTHSPLPGGQP